MKIETRTTTMMAPYMSGGHQPYALATLWLGCQIVGQVPLVNCRKRVSWLPLWFPFNADTTTTPKQAAMLFAVVATKWERQGDTSMVPKWLRNEAVDLAGVVVN
jgi:hypothetical protein